MKDREKAKEYDWGAKRRMTEKAKDREVEKKDRGTNREAKDAEKVKAKDSREMEKKDRETNREAKETEKVKAKDKEKREAERCLRIGRCSFRGAGIPSRRNSGRDWRRRRKRRRWTSWTPKRPG